jgi:hypothetical protein
MCEDRRMAEPPVSAPESPSGSTPELSERLEALGRSLGAREAAHGEALSRARSCAERLRGDVVEALEHFHRAASAAGASHLRIAVSEVRPDDKHLRAVEFELMRGRHRAIVVAKSRGEVTLVGPFRTGKTEGPCLSFPFDADDEIRPALLAFLERFLEEAATP